MPQTIVVPTQAQLAQWHNSPTSLLAMYQAAQQPKPVAGSPGATNVPGVAPGSTTISPSIVTPVNVPQFTPQDLPEVPKNNPDWIKSMTEMINQLNMQGQQAANAARIPGGAGLEARSSSNIGSALSGALPQDVVNQIGQRAAERGVGSGSPWGANTNADYLKAIGLNSLQLQNTGQDWLTAALGRNPAAPLFDPSRLVITPLQEAQFGLERGNLSLNQIKTQADIANSNAQRQLQSDLANASNQLERDRLVWQYEQNRLQRENALRIAQMEVARRGTGTGYGGGSSGGGGGFNPASNYAPTSTATPTPLNVPWHLPPSNTGMPFYPNTGQGGLDTVQPGMDFGGGFDVVQPGSNYNPGINTTGMSQDELDWLYNVGG